MDWSFLLYVVVSIVFLLGVTYKSVTEGAPITAAILFIGIFIAIIYFGIQWFTTYGNVVNQNGAWPPDGSINVCPDFFSLAKGTGGAYVCKDPLGVSTMGSGEFNLYMGSTTRTADLCTECKTYGASWEGVYDGTSCVANNRTIPIPPSS